MLAPSKAAATSPPTLAPADELRQRTIEALEQAGYPSPDATVVDVLTALGAGYRLGPANPPAWLKVDVNTPIAAAMVERFKIGDRAHDIDRSTHRVQTRMTVNYNLDQLPGGPTGEAERRVLAAFCLGSWDPSVDTNAERNAIASFVIPWYLAGRSA